MPTIEEAIAKLEASGVVFLPPATDDDIRALEGALQCTLPEDVTALYRHGDGTEPADRDDWTEEDWEQAGEFFRLMSCGEAAEMHAMLADVPVMTTNRRCLWDDDQSNNAAVYVDGPSRERVCVMWHDDPDGSPRYRSVASFVNALAEVGLRGFIPGEEPLPDYPTLAPTECDNDDWSVVQELTVLFESADDSDDRVDYASQLITLTPYDRTETLYRFAKDEDFYIAETACKLLGLRRWEPALELLADIAQNGMSNARTAATMALGQIGTEAALGKLVSVHESLTPDEARGYSHLFGQALELCGCAVDWSDPHHHRYRRPGSADWIPLAR